MNRSILIGNSIYELNEKIGLRKMWNFNRGSLTEKLSRILGVRPEMIAIYIYICDNYPANGASSRNHILRYFHRPARIEGHWAKGILDCSKDILFEFLREMERMGLIIDEVPTSPHKKYRPNLSIQRLIEKKLEERKEQQNVFEEEIKQIRTDPDVEILSEIYNFGLNRAPPAWNFFTDLTDLFEMICDLVENFRQTNKDAPEDIELRCDSNEDNFTVIRRYVESDIYFDRYKELRIKLSHNPSNRNSSVLLLFITHPIMFIIDQSAYTQETVAFMFGAFPNLVDDHIRHHNIAIQSPIGRDE